MVIQTMLSGLNYDKHYIPCHLLKFEFRIILKSNYVNKKIVILAIEERFGIIMKKKNKKIKINFLL